ncbi:MAG: type I-C CRISPR-associated protein Cas8c/Csd1, partial [Bifidobacterium adolescentis]
MPASTSQRRTKPKVRRNSDVIDVITMYLEPNRDDRDYLYGRLLALADNFEESVLRKQGVKDRP